MRILLGLLDERVHGEVRGRPSFAVLLHGCGMKLRRLVCPEVSVVVGASAVWVGVAEYGSTHSWVATVHTHYKMYRRGSSLSPGLIRHPGTTGPRAGWGGGSTTLGWDESAFLRSLG